MVNITQLRKDEKIRKYRCMKVRGQDGRVCVGSVNNIFILLHIRTKKAHIVTESQCNKSGGVLEFKNYCPVTGRDAISVGI